MAGYTEFQVTEPFISSLPKLLANDKSALTWNAGTSFPTTGLTAGMPCFRTDEQKLYVYDGTIWNVLIDLNDKPILASTGKFVAYDRAQTLQADWPEHRGRAQTAPFLSGTDGIAPPAFYSAKA